MKKNDFLKEPGKNESYEEESEQRAEEEQFIENQRKQYFYYYSRLESEEENINPYANRLVRSPYGNNFVKSPYGNNFVKNPYGNNFVKSPYENNFVKTPYGNNFTKSPNAPRVHAKLKVSNPNDPCELEADRVAENVLNRKESEKQTGSHQNENRIKAKSFDGMTVDMETESRINSLGSGHPLPDSERSFYEERIGSDFSNVRIHDDQESHELAKNLNAKAFTKGTDIVFGEDEYRPGTDEGKKLLAHELAHVEQGGVGDRIIRRDGVPDIDTWENMNQEDDSKRNYTDAELIARMIKYKFDDLFEDNMFYTPVFKRWEIPLTEADKEKGSEYEAQIKWMKWPAALLTALSAYLLLRKGKLPRRKSVQEVLDEVVMFVKNRGGNDRFNIEGQLKTIFENKRLFLNWLKGSQSISRINNPLSHTQADQIIQNARKLGISADLNPLGLQGLEKTGQWAGIPHIKIGNIHIPVEKGFNP